MVTRGGAPEAVPIGEARPLAARWRALAGVALNNPALFMALILLAMWLVLSRLSPHFFTLDNLFEITVQAAVIALIAVGQTFVILSGGIDLSVGAVLAVTTVVSAIVMDRGLGLAAGIAAGILVGAGFGAANG